MRKQHQIALIVSLLILSCSVLTVYYLWTQTDDSMMLSCHSELFDRNAMQDIDSRHTLVADISIKGSKAQVNYRYFNVDGSSAGNIIMQAKVDDVSDDKRHFRLLITDKDVRLNDQGRTPAHLKYLAYVNGLSMNEDNLPALNFEVLDYDKSKDYAVILFQPSNTVCGCQLMTV